MTTALTSVGIIAVSIAIAASGLNNTATIPTVGSGAFIEYQGETSSDSTTAASSFTRAELTNSTTVTLNRNTSSSATCQGNAQIIDADTTNYVNNVQSGTIAVLTASTTGAATITSVTNADAGCNYLGLTSAVAASFLLRVPCSLSLTLVTVTATRSASNGAETVGFCVPQFQGAALNSAVQKISIASAASGIAFTVTISSVTQGNTLLLQSGYTSGANSTDHRKAFGRMALTSATVVTLTVVTAPSTSNNWNAVVVELVSGLVASSVQRGTIALSTQTSNTGTVTSTPTASSLANWCYNDSTQSTFSMAAASCRFEQTNATTLTVSVNTAASPTGSYELIGLNPGSADASVNPTGIAGTGAVGTSVAQVSGTLTGVAGTGAVGTVTPNIQPTITGITGTGAVGTPTVTIITDATANPSGIAGTGSVGTMIAQISPTVTGIAGTGAVGTVTPQISKTPTGIAGTGAVGIVAVNISASVTPTGISGTGSVGVVTPQLSPAVTGVSGAGAVGSPSVTVGISTVTGISASGAVSGPANQIAITPIGVQGSGQVGTPTVTTNGDATVSVVGIQGLGQVGTPQIIIVNPIVAAVSVPGPSDSKKEDADARQLRLKLEWHDRRRKKKAAMEEAAAAMQLAKDKIKPSASAAPPADKPVKASISKPDMRLIAERAVTESMLPHLALQQIRNEMIALRNEDDDAFMIMMGD